MTCQGRDHLLADNIVIVNVHFEPELTICGKYLANYVLFTHTGLLIQWCGRCFDFNICDPEEGRFNVWNQSFTRW